MKTQTFFLRALLLLLTGAMAACSATGVPLAGDQTFESLCPASGCADAKPDVNQLTIKGPGTTLIQSRVVSGDGVEFGGDCYASTYQDNLIEVSLLAANGNTINLGTADVISVHQASTIPKCVQGRYHFVIVGSKMPLTGSGGNQVFTVKAEIIGIDENGQRFENSNTGQFSVSVTRYAPATQ